MQTLRLILTVALLSALSAGASDNGVAGLSSLPVAAQANISAALGRDSSEYYARPVSGGFEASSPGLAARFTSSGVEVSSGSAHWGLALRGYGYGNALWGVNAVAPQATKNRVEYRHGTMIEWYMNGPMGLEQGFTISQQPGKANGQPLTIALETSGDLAATAGDSGTSLNLSKQDGEELLRYTGLTAYDADGKELHATLRVQSQQLLLQVDDRNARYPVVVDPVVQLAKLTASDGQSGDGLGISVAISGDVLVAGTFANAAYVFVKPPSGWKNMTQTAKLAPSDGTTGTYVSVAIGGNVILLGEPDATTNGNTGIAYVFVKPPTGWKDTSETLRLLASDGQPGDRFGSAVAISGGTAVIGAGWATVNGNQFQGAAYVFTKPAGDLPKLESMVVTETAKLTASDGAEGDFFADGGVSISGGTIAIGAFAADRVNELSKGEAYVFVKPPSGWVSMTQTAALKASDIGGSLGISIAINGSTVAAGAPTANRGGTVYVYVKPDNGWANMTETAQLRAQKLGWSFSQSVAIDGSGQAIAAGAPSGNGQHNFSGDVFVFLKPPGGWKTTSQYKYRIFSSDGQSGDRFGEAVAISGKVLAVGADSATIGSNPTQGAAYVFGQQ